MGSPLIEWNLAALVWFGFTDLYVSLSADEPELACWIHEQSTLLLDEGFGTVSTLVEDTPLGTIGAARLVSASATDLVVVNVDNLTNLDLAALLERHRALGGAVTIACHEQPFRIPFGRLELDGTRVTAYREKPQVQVPISSGVYVLSRKAIDAIPRDKRVDVPQLIDALLACGGSVHAYPHAADWFDINDEPSLAAAEAAIVSLEWPCMPGTVRSG